MVKRPSSYLFKLILVTFLGSSLIFYYRYLSTSPHLSSLEIPAEDNKSQSNRNILVSDKQGWLVPLAHPTASSRKESTRRMKEVSGQVLSGWQKIVNYFPQPSDMPGVHSTVDNTSLHNGRVMILETFVYPAFSLPPPRFISDRDLEHFKVEVNSSDFVSFHNEESRLVGKLVLIRDALWMPDYDCGYASKLEPLLETDAPGDSELLYFPSEPIAPLIVPDSYSFQHFVDGALPKLVQAYGFIRRVGAKLLLHEPRDKIIHDILHRIGFTDSDLIFIKVDEVPFKVEYMIYTCWTPPIHPVLWRTAQVLLGVAPPLARTGISQQQRKVVLISRNKENSYNGGRMLENQDEIVKMLQSRYKKNFYLFDNSNKGKNFTFDALLKLYRKAKMIIGAHGGGLYNLNFAPPGQSTHIIELCPVQQRSGTYQYGGSKWIFYVQAGLLNQTYWHVHMQPVTSQGDMHINLHKLQSVLNLVDIGQISRK